MTKGRFLKEIVRSLETVRILLLKPSCRCSRSRISRVFGYLFGDEGRSLSGIGSALGANRVVEENYYTN